MNTPLTKLTLASVVFSLTGLAGAEPVFNGKNLDGWFMIPESPAI